MDAAIDRTVTTVIDPDKCTGCGLCVRVCPSQTISLIDGLAVVTGDRSMGCGHCAAVCPEGAVTVGAIDPGLGRFATFQSSEIWLPHGEFEAGELVRLMRSRRSCRNYAPDPVEPELLADLVRIGLTAPSGTNSQPWSFTVLPDRAAVVTLGNGIREFFEATNRLANRAWLRKLLALIGKNELEVYHREYYDSVIEGLADWRERGLDRLFHGATSAIIISTRPGSSCPVEDALLAAQNILLAAHALGLGSCLVGFAVSAMAREAKLKGLVGIPAEETVRGVIALGRPAESYETVGGRKPVPIRWFTATKEAHGPD